MTDHKAGPDDGVQGQANDGIGRRDFLKGTGALIGAGGMLSLMPPGIRSAAWAAGSDRPEKTELSIGFIPLTDCASVVMAQELGLYKKYGLNVRLSKETSWAAVRDKLMLGHLDAAHVLYGLVYGVHLGIGGPCKNMAILMGLNHNGQAITLSNQLKDKGATDGRSLAKLIGSDQRSYVFAQTFPTGTHALWLYYWLAAHGIHPLQHVRTIVVPPPRMIAEMRAGNMDGCCVGEPWNARAVSDGIGFTAVASQTIWPDHPEKVLATTQEFVQQHPNTVRALMRAVLEASRHIDAAANRRQVSRIIAGKAYVDAPEHMIEERLMGTYENGLGRRWRDPQRLKFFDDGQVNFPHLSHGMWFLTQFRRWGLLKQDIDYLATAQQVNQVALYTEVATGLGISVPESAMKTERFFDGTLYDPGQAQAYANGFEIRA